MIDRLRWLPALALFAGVCSLGGCKPRFVGLGEGPPVVDENTTVLAAFKPADLADPAASGIDLDNPAGSEQPPSVALPPPAMIEYGPIGDTSEYANIELRFNRPVAALGDHERLDPKTIGLVIEPKLEGEFYFVEPTRLIFAPSEVLPPAQVYTVRLDSRFQAVDGPEFEAKANWSFATTPPSISLWMNDEGLMRSEALETYHWKSTMRLDGGGNIRLEQLRKHVRAESTNAQGKVEPIAVEVRKLPKNRDGYYEAEFELRPKTHWPAGREVVVRVGEGLVGREGPRPMGHEEALSFRVAAGVEVTSVGCYSGDFEDGCDLGPILVQFSAPVPRSQASRVSVGPKTVGFDTLATDRDEQWDDRQARNAYWSVLAWGDYALGANYEVTIDAGLRDVHGQSLAGKREFEIDFVEPPPSLALQNHLGTLIHSKNPRAGLETRHAKELRLRVAVLDDATYERILVGSLTELKWPTKGATLHDERITPTHQGSFAWASTELDLHKFTGSRPGAVLFEASVASLLPRAANRTTPPAQRGLVQITDLGVSVVGSLTDSWIRVADITTDKPTVGAEIELIDSPGGKRRVLGKTDADGLLALPSAAKIPDAALVRASKGDDRVLLAIAQLRRADSTSDALKVGESVRIALTSERKLYKPGEVIRAMGWATVASPYEFSGVRPLPPKTRVTLELRDHRGEIVDTRTATAKAHGKFWATMQVPASGALGDYSVTAALLGGTSVATVEVKDFVAPEFEVTAQGAKPDLHHGQTSPVSVNARYYFGGPVKITRVREAIACNEADFRPPGLAPEWSVGPRREHWGGTSSLPAQLSLPATAERGHLETSLVPTGLSSSHPGHCTYSIAIADATQREVGAETTAWVHPPFYLAATVPSYVMTKSDVEIPIRTLEFDGSALPVGKVEVSLVRRWSEDEWVTEKGKKVYAGMRERTKELPVCKTDTKSGPASCKFLDIAPGSYTVTVRAEQAGYEPKIEGWFWVPEPHRAWTWSHAPASHLNVEVDKPKPKPGEPIKARVTAPWSSGKGMLIVAKGGVHEVRRFNLVQGAAEFEFTTSDAWIPHVELWAMMVDPAAHTGRHPRLVTANASVDLGNETRSLSVAVEVPTEARTGDMLPIVVQARDAKDQPVRGHVSVWAVDEAVLALAPLELPNFLDAFTVNFGGGLGFADGYGALIFPYVMHGDYYSQMEFVMGWARKPDDVFGMGGLGYGGSGTGYGGGAGRGSMGGSSGEGMPAARSKFSAAPIFIGDAELDANGVAKLSGELPDNLTTFRVTAVVSGTSDSGDVETRFGHGDARVRVTRPVIVRAALPRIMRPGDTAEVGILVDNLRAGAGEVEIEVALHDPDGTLELLSPPTAKMSIGAGEQVRVPIKVRAFKTGIPHFEARARVRPQQGQPEADAIKLPLPIEPERTLTDRVAVYGTMDDDRPAVLPFELPTEIDPAFGGLSVSIGSSMLGGVEDAVEYLVGYPHGCVEQTSSSLLPLIPLGKLAKTYPLGIADTDEYVASGIARLRSMQLPSGGFGYWPGATSASDYGSAYATWVLGRAQAAGYPVPQPMLDTARAYLTSQVELWVKQTAPSDARDIEIALALSVLAEAGMATEVALTKLYDRRQGMPSFAKSMLLLALHGQAATDPRIAVLLAELRSFVDEREASARMEDANAWTWYWDSNVRSSALMLMAMLAVDPQHVLVPKLARGLLDARRGGRWSNTQENAYALIALADYAAIYEADEPNFEGRVWIDRTAIAKVRVEGRSFEFQDGFTGMADLLAADQQDPAASRLLLERAGVGRMYYRVGLEWASTASDQPAKSEGLTVKRTLRNMAGVIADDQTIETGSLLALDVELDTRSELTHVAIELPLPAGLEAVDLGLGKGTGAMKISGHQGWFVSHQELRRDRAVVFADRVTPGTHIHTVYLRATTPGEYVMPPASAEMMYYPEVYGRTAARRVKVQ